MKNVKKKTKLLKALDFSLTDILQYLLSLLVLVIIFICILIDMFGYIWLT